MGYRKFVDRQGVSWEVRERSQSEWEFLPLSGNPGDRRPVPSPGYEKDPFELSVEELQRMLDSTGGPRASSKKSPFLDS